MTGIYKSKSLPVGDKGAIVAYDRVRGMTKGEEERSLGYKAPYLEKGSVDEKFIIERVMDGDEKEKQLWVILQGVKFLSKLW